MKVKLPADLKYGSTFNEKIQSPYIRALNKKLYGTLE
jgi:hypothetical protein